MPSVEFARDVTVLSPPSSIWEAVTDIDQVSGWVSVVGSVNEQEYLSRYSATLTDQLGPFRLSADLEVSVTGVVEHRSIAFPAEGEDRQVASRIKIEAELVLQPNAGGTHIDVAGRYEVTGRVAALGASMIRAKGEKILDQFFESLETELG